MAGPISPGTTQAVDITANMRGRQRSGYPRDIATYATAGTTPAPRPCTARPATSTAMLGAVPPMVRPAAKKARPASIGQPSGTRSAQVPASTMPMRLDSMKALNTQPYSCRSPRCRLTTGSTVAMASASKATRVTASTRPIVRDRRSGAHTPPGESASVGVGGRGVGAARSVLISASLKPHAQLTSRPCTGGSERPGQAGYLAGPGHGGGSREATAGRVPPGRPVAGSTARRGGRR